MYCYNEYKKIPLKSNLEQVYVNTMYYWKGYRKEQEKRLEQEKRTIQKREKLQQLYNGSAESLVKFIGGYYHQDEKNEVLNMAFDKLVEWPVGCVRTMEAKGAHAFFELCGELVKSEPRPRHEILNMVLTLIGGEAA